MVIPPLALVFALVALSLLLWGGVVYVVPRNLRSLFRYRLWTIRDRIVDEVLSGELPDSPVVRGLILMVESAIRHAGDATLMRFLLIPPLPCDYRKEWLEFWDTGLKELSDDQRARFEKHRDLLGKALVKRLVSASIGGWILFVVVCAMVFFRAIFAGVRSWVSNSPIAPHDYARELSNRLGNENLRRQLQTLNSLGDETDPSAVGRDVPLRACVG